MQTAPHERPVITLENTGHTNPPDQTTPVWDSASDTFQWRTSMSSISILSGDGSHRWTNMPAANTFLLGSHAHVCQIDLTDFSEVRLLVNQQTDAAAGAKLTLKYRSSFSSNIANYSDILTGGLFVNLASAGAAPGIFVTSWSNITSGAQADVVLAIAGSGGDGVIDPEFGWIGAQFR